MPSMERYHLEASSKTPGLLFDPAANKFEISGRSIPENSIDFYRPLLDWLDEYVKSPNSETVLEIKLEYFNTSSSKILVEILRKLEKIQSKGKTVVIRWYYEEEDEDMLESGEDFKEIISIPIEMIQTD